MSPEENGSDSYQLDQINTEVVTLMTPLIVYLSVVMFFGLLGNILVCFYYGHETRRSGHAVFICTLALFDLATCALSIPLEFVDTKFYYTFTNIPLCRFLSFVNQVTVMGSAFTLLAIAVDRFRRICRPLKKQLDLTKCKLVCVLSFVLSLVYSWPALILYTSVEVDLRASSGRIVKGHDCATSTVKSYKTYIWGHNVLYLITFIIGTGTLVVMYSLVGKAIYQHKRYVARNHSNHTDVQTPQTSRCDIGVEKNEASCDGKSQINEMQQNEECSNNVSIKYTMIMLVIAAVFIISFLPYLILVILNAFLGIKDSAKGGALVAYKIGSRSYFLMSAINPMIYGLLNTQFRKYYSSKLVRCNRCEVRSKNLQSSSDATATTNV
ncbi:cholecystokinin receptor-like [Dreissena polymorpha]|uniref:G-protein coupled receptors family 1 profile domain-containing protein n=1 Tax=Dreissena polymorpha TaxID=45954 RepID=A0A9D3Z1M3_DREPO|nr:cholecystokinin receptor-like [Dreissena polymorpha]XP_052250800.1 cholecystokinin receptor-like [Dreissena polymorpha]KAH3711413.1 hypothetical protein DPMN_071082 [Dreissena polymorpha]